MPIQDSSGWGQFWRKRSMSLMQYGIAIGCVLSILGCPKPVVEPTADDQSAIAYAKQAVRGTLVGLDHAIAGTLTSVKDEGEYRLLSGDFFSLHDTSTILANFQRFCQSLGGTMERGACKAGGNADSNIRFFVRILSHRIRGDLKVDLKVYEPVGAPSDRFVRAIRQYGYLTQAERDAEAQEQQQRMAAEQARHQQAAAEEETRKHQRETERERRFQAEQRQRTKAGTPVCEDREGVAEPRQGFTEKYENGKIQIRLRSSSRDIIWDSPKHWRVCTTVE
jgi:hypothetical protein